MNYEPGTLVKIQRTIQDTSGALINADSLPVGNLIRNGDDTLEVVIVSNIATGKYKFVYTIPSNWAIGDSLDLRVEATVGGIAAGAVVWSAILFKTIISGPVSITLQDALNVSQAVTLSGFRSSITTFLIAVFDSEGEPITLPNDLTFIVETSNDTPEEVFTIDAPPIQGADSEIAAVTTSVSNMDQTPGKYKWRLWDGDTVLAHGDFVILPSSGS